MTWPFEDIFAGPSPADPPEDDEDWRLLDDLAQAVSALAERLRHEPGLSRGVSIRRLWHRSSMWPRPPGDEWISRDRARRLPHDGAPRRVRRPLLTRNGKDWTGRFLVIVQTASGLKVRSCLIDGEAVCCDENGLAVFALLRHRERPAENLPLRLRPPRA
jgi:hypothetical protein